MNAEKEINNLKNDAASIMHQLHSLLDSAKYRFCLIRENKGSSEVTVDGKIIEIKDVLDKLKDINDTTRNLNKWKTLLLELKTILAQRRCTIESNIQKHSRLKIEDKASSSERQKDCMDLQCIEEDLR